MPEVTNRLSNCENMSLGERAAQRRASMSARAETDPLVWISKVWTAVKIIPLKPRQVHQHLLWRRLAGQRRDRHCFVLFVAHYSGTLLRLAI